MAKRENRQDASRLVTRTECTRDPGAVLLRAKREGAIVVTDSRGRKRGVLYAPSDRKPFIVAD
jgi:hypothetical protein